MTLEKLKNKATPTPWKATGPSISSKGHGYIVKALEVFMDRSEREANAKLVTHCVNNFDRAVEALEQQRILLLKAGDDKEACDLYDLIEELKTVGEQ
jgi:hypothetical protein